MQKFKKGDLAVIDKEMGFTDYLRPYARVVVAGSENGVVVIRSKGWKGGHDCGADYRRYGVKKNSTELWMTLEGNLTPVPAEIKVPALTPKLQAVLTHLSKGLTLTQGEAIILGYGTRLSDLIHRLRARGYDIRTTTKHDLKGTPYGEYKLVTRNRFGDVKKEPRDG